MCCLSSVNLGKFVLNPFTKEAEFDYAGFNATVAIGVRFLDNVLSVTKYPIPEIAEQALKYRRIGLGITALGDALAMLGIKYGSYEGVQEVNNIFKALAVGSYSASVELAKEKGVFEAYNSNYLSSKFVESLPQNLRDDIYSYGIRNAYLNTVAPTGTTSLSVGNNCSSGIEPIFSLEYDRKYRTGKGDETEIETVRDDAYLKYIKLKESGVEVISEEFFQVANDLKFEDHTAVQAVAQYWVDQSISKTINLPSGTTKAEMKSIYIDAWKNKLKGCTVFHPDGLLAPILGAKKESTTAINLTSAPERPTELPCEVKLFNYGRQSYFALVGMLDDKPFEIFVVESHGEHFNKHRGKFTIRKKGSNVYQLMYDGEVLFENISERLDFNDSAGTVCLMASVQLQYGIPVDVVVKQLQKKGLITSFPKAVARALKKFIPDLEASVENPCPECGEPMRRTEGCFMCDSCGYGRCG